MIDSQTISSIFKISGHEVRVDLLKALKEDSMTSSGISELFGTTPAYVHRHLQILVEGGLIEKKGRNFTLTSIGRIFVNSLGRMEVITNYNDFWIGHTLSKIPESLMERMFVLRNSKIVKPAPIVIDKLMEMISGSRKRILGITDRLPEITVSALKKSIENGVEISYALIGDIPPNYEMLYQDVELPATVRIKTIDPGNIYMGILIVDNKEAGFILPDKNGVLDWNCGMVGKDTDFVSWVEENFWNMYNMGHDFVKE